MYGALQPSAHDREVIAQALNERFVELGGNHPVPYSESDAGQASGGTSSDEIAAAGPLDWSGIGEGTTCPQNA